jgi:hypothetical protein
VGGGQPHVQRTNGEEKISAGKEKVCENDKEEAGKIKETLNPRRGRPARAD